MRPNQISKSDSGPMAKVGECFPLGAKKPAKQKWVFKKRLYLGSVNGHQRIMAHVYWKTMSGKRFFLMDVITGTLYRKSDGRCITSDTLKLISLKKEKDLAKKLLNLKVNVIVEGGENESD